MPSPRGIRVREGHVVGVAGGAAPEKGTEISVNLTPLDSGRVYEAHQDDAGILAHPGRLV